ncbi:MAG: hypothetical protein U5R48_11185 [Gammaproteobacteria bacterium]|nr:hypothetical protein [Gammaproteobacteria bacterium]
MPLLEETGYMPSEKYVRGPEIRAHCERIAAQYGLYEKALFHTEVNDHRMAGRESSLAHPDKSGR